MSAEDFGCYLKFFQYCDGKSNFNFQEFQIYFSSFSKWLRGEKLNNRSYSRDPESLLQFFYDVNIIGYREDTDDQAQTYYHWSFRERTLNNISPKVKFGTDLMINPGIAKSLDIGKRFKESAVDIQAPPRARTRGYKRKKPSASSPIKK
jgi:hypothetical protein